MTGEPIMWKVLDATQRRWRVVDATASYVESVLLGDGPNDAWRIAVSIDGPADVAAQVIYPCAVCGWGRRCGVDGEDCHA